eukprot:16407-Heterococcus_DN1.PRE.1
MRALAKVARMRRSRELLQVTRAHHPNPFDDKNGGWKNTRGWKAAHAEADLPTTAHDAEVARGLVYGLPGASSIEDRNIPTFSRGELPHFAGINTFMKAPFIEDIREVGNYDVAVLGIPFDGGDARIGEAQRTHLLKHLILSRPGTRFGPQAIRRISALYTPYNYETGVDLREQMTIRTEYNSSHAAELLNGSTATAAATVTGVT